MSIQENKTLVRSYWEEVENKKNFALMDKLFARDYTHHDPGLPPEMQNGLENYKKVTAMFYVAMPDLKGTQEDVIAEGDRVVSRMIFRGTHRGDLMGIPPTGKKVTIDVLAIHRISEGKIAEAWVNFDALGLMRQLGAIPAPETAAR